jgi:hypothetical protein
MKLQTKQPTTQKNLTFGLTIILTILFGALVTQGQTTSVLTAGLNNPAKIITAGQASLLAGKSGITATNDIVFQSSRDGNPEIYAMKADDTNQVRLTSNTEQDSVPLRNERRAGPAHAVLFDYFGTGSSNYVIRNVENDNIRWDILENSVTSPLQTRRVYFGLPKDTPVYGDFDGDLKTDIGVWREGTTENPQSYFYILPSSDSNGFIAQPWGIRGDLPVTGDFDGDSKTDFCVTRREGGQIIWYILPSGGGSLRSIVFGTEDDLENFASLDFDGDGLDDLIVTRRDQNGNLTHYIGDAQTGALILAQEWGSDKTEPTFVLFGDYIGDSRADIAIVYSACESNANESNTDCEIGGTWWIKETGSPNHTVTKFGIPFNPQTNTGDLPNLGDYDGDGKFDISVFRRTNSTVYTLGSSDEQIIAQYFDGDSAVPPADTNMLENPIEPRSKSIPVSALKTLMIYKQPDGTLKIGRATDFNLKN